jgi:hypothetical protein
VEYIHTQVGTRVRVPVNIHRKCDADEVFWSVSRATRDTNGMLHTDNEQDGIQHKLHSMSRWCAKLLITALPVPVPS